MPEIGSFIGAQFRPDHVAQGRQGVLNSRPHDTLGDILVFVTILVPGISHLPPGNRGMAGFHFGRDPPRSFGDDLKTAFTAWKVRGSAANRVKSKPSTKLPIKSM